MTVPASPFAGRLLAEIAKVRDGVPAAAAEMGVAPQVIDAIANGEQVSTDNLNAVYAWLVDRVALRPEEAEDYRRMQAVAREGTRWISPSSPSGLPDTQTGPARGGRSKWTTREVTLATAVVVLIIALTVVITIVVVRPGNSASTATKASATSATPITGTTSATASPLVPVPATSTNPPTSTASPQLPPSPADGKLIASYNNFKLSQGYGIIFAAGGPPQPEIQSGDLVYSAAADRSFSNSSGTVALLSGEPPSFTNCKTDTAVGGDVSSVSQGDTVCFQGHGIVAAAYVVNFASSGGIAYATLDVHVWQDSSQSQGA